jgi:hypothetical protein
MPEINSLLSHARDLQTRAEEVLAQTEAMEDAEAQQNMRDIAAYY